MDHQVLEKRIWNVLEVFSQWSNNPKKDILRLIRGEKLSSENLRRPVKKQTSEEEKQMREQQQTTQQSAASNPAKPKERRKLRG